MAGGAGGGDGLGQGNLQGGVWVGVAFQAVRQPEMGGSLVATAAGRDHVFVAGGMADVTVQAGEFIAMGHAISLQGGDDGRMALDAILEGERRWRWRRRFAGWLGDGLVGRAARELQEGKDGNDDAKIFGCKYHPAYYYHGDVALSSRRWHRVSFGGGWEKGSVFEELILFCLRPVCLVGQRAQIEPVAPLTAVSRAWLRPLLAAPARVLMLRKARPTSPLPRTDTIFLRLTEKADLVKNSGHLSVRRHFFPL